MALITCPDCEARVSSSAAECVRCGTPLRPERADAPRRVRRRRDVVAVVLACVFIVTVSWLTIATVPESEAGRRQRNRAASKALAGLRVVRAAEEEYHRRNGRYASWLGLFEPWSRTAAEREASRYFYVRLSSDRQAYISIQNDWDENTACAEVVRHGPETAASRALDTGSWKLVPNGPPRCRKTLFPWQWLHWAGIGYLDMREVGAVDG